MEKKNNVKNKKKIWREFFVVAGLKLNKVSFQVSGERFLESFFIQLGPGGIGPNFKYESISLIFRWVDVTSTAFLALCIMKNTFILPMY